MFSKTLDSKSTYTDNDGNELIDLGESIFSSKGIFNSIGYTTYRIPKNFEMRPDLISRSAYSEEDEAEMLMKYNNIQNPFSINEDDILIFPSSTQIDKFVGVQTEEEKSNADALYRNFHKYVDDKKVPDTVGSESNTKTISKSSGTSNLTGNTATRFKEANMAKAGASSITEINGKLYFGTNTGMKCAADGISTTDYMNQIIKNSTNK